MEKSLKSTVLQLLHSKKHVDIEEKDGLVIHIEQPVPYIAVYRIPEGSADYFTGILDRTESSHLMFPPARKKEVMELLEALAKEYSTLFGAFLIIELWIDQQTEGDYEMKIVGPEKRTPTTFTALEKELIAISVPGSPVRVSTDFQPIVAPEGETPLLSKEFLKDNEALLIGLAIKPFYVNRETGDYYPVFTRLVRAHLGRALKKSFFEFVRLQTSLDASNFYMLGSSRITKTVLEVDDALAEIGSKFQFLLLVSPINTDSAWEQFKESKYQRKPVFHYRLMPVDPEIAKRGLYDIPIERIEDPTLAYIFRDKRSELDKMLSMLMQRDSTDFIQSSIQLFGSVSRQLYDAAKAILTIIHAPTQKDETARYITAEQFAERAKQEFAYFASQDPDIHLEVEVNRNTDSLMVAGRKLYVAKGYNIPENRVEALIQHEVGTHMLTYLNGKAQPLKQLYHGVPGYEELQEGLAVLAEYLAGGLTNDRLRILAARAVAAKHMVDGDSFQQTFELLYDDYKFNARDAFGIVTRIYRGGGLTKDAVYLRGLMSLLDNLSQGQDLRMLLIGKIRESYLPIIEELVQRKMLKPLTLTPRYLRDPESLKRLEAISKGFDVFDLIQNRTL